MSEIGDNSGDRSFKVTASELRGFIEQYERLEAEKTELGEQMGDVKRDAKSRGYDMKAFAAVLRRRKQDRAEVQELDAVINLYEDALGVFA